jgi:hypothetical protein
MSPLNILYGSLAVSAFFVAGFLLGVWLTLRTMFAEIKPEQTQMEVKPVVPLPVAVPVVQPPKPDAGRFIVKPDQRTNLERQEEQRMGELLEGLDLPEA